MPQRAYLASIILINPVTVMIASTVLWGFWAHLPIVMIALDFSNMFAKTVWEKTSSKNTLDWDYVKSHQSKLIQ